MFRLFARQETRTPWLSVRNRERQKESDEFPCNHFIVFGIVLRSVFIAGTLHHDTFATLASGFVERVQHLGTWKSLWQVPTADPGTAIDFLVPDVAIFGQLIQ